MWWLDLTWRTVHLARRRPWLLTLPFLAAIWLEPRGLSRVAAVVPLLLRLWFAGSSRNLPEGPRP